MMMMTTTTITSQNLMDTIKTIPIDKYKLFIPLWDLYITLSLYLTVVDKPMVDSR